MMEYSVAVIIPLLRACRRAERCRQGGGVSGVHAHAQKHGQRTGGLHDEELHTDDDQGVLHAHKLASLSFAKILLNSCHRSRPLPAARNAGVEGFCSSSASCQRPELCKLQIIWHWRRGELVNGVQVPEHTWGEDVKVYLNDYDSWSNGLFGDARSMANYRHIEVAWMRQRSYTRWALEALEEGSSAVRDQQSFS